MKRVEFSPVVRTFPVLVSKRYLLSTKNIGVSRRRKISSYILTFIVYHAYVILWQMAFDFKIVSVIAFYLSGFGKEISDTSGCIREFP